MKCFVCEAELNGSKMLLRHFRLVHGFVPGKTLRLKCVEAGCGSVFGTFSGFRKHLHVKHAEQSDRSFETFDNRETANTDEQSNAETSDQTGSPGEVASASVLLKSQKSTLDMCASAVAELRVAGVSQSVLNGFVLSMEEIVFEIHSQAQDAALLCLSPQDTATKRKIENSFENLENPFTLLNSEAKRKRIFTEKWGTVEPRTFDQVVVTDKFAYIPILETLKAMLQNPHLTDLFKPRHVPKEGVYVDLSDAAYFKSNPLFNSEKDALQIQLFYDDFETANPLGSKKGIHKLGAIYFTLRNFPPVFNSSLVNIHLFNDLKVLEIEGVENPLTGDFVRGTIVQVTGDNLGLHSLLGFLESFRARYCCRFCLLEIDHFQSVFCEDNPEVVLRTTEMHDLHCDTLQTDSTLPHVYGVKRVCALNSLKYFNTANNFAVDIMHDILEGVAQLEVKLVLQYVQQNFLSADDLAGRIHAFDYGYTQQRNRPPAVKLFDGSNDLGLNAIQSWCLLRNMPLIFGDLVQRDDEHWHLLILLLHIANVAFSPVQTDGMTTFLKYLIIEHHQLFKKLFPEKNLLPKHHIMIHYPRCIRKIGPILHMWCMRYEAKHKFFKTQLKSFKNITKTLAIKHQSCMAMCWESFSQYRLSLGPGKMVELSELKGGQEIASKLGVVMSESVYSVKWIKHHGTEYRPDCIICTDVTCEMPVFCKVKSIAVKDENVLLLGTLMETVFFDDHYHAFTVRLHPERVLKVVNVNELCYFKPFDLQMKYGKTDSALHIVPYCHFMQT
ncbi:hypothetical protein IRJ41_002977 [Triplophysa rosa]|uniref:C2H2-type domain-containing protein n=1 Tax=Triplophysa rosa TaxID=992332 RepID=A0A9W8C6M6_TRIRA|nr:hypothetical protein IRJ41_002977 [Triplophysa rosa]